jgi:hypothetical protein
MSSSSRVVERSKVSRNAAQSFPVLVERNHESRGCASLSVESGLAPLLGSRVPLGSPFLKFANFLSIMHATVQFLKSSNIIHYTTVI